MKGCILISGVDLENVEAMVFVLSGTNSVYEWQTIIRFFIAPSLTSEALPNKFSDAPVSIAYLMYAYTLAYIQL